MTDVPVAPRRIVLDRAPVPRSAPPVLDADQAAVVAHRGGPLLVLAGPGTGKTTTLVETMVARLAGDDALAPERILGLTFGRRAAQSWREQVTARLGGGIVPQIATFHSLSYALVRKERADYGHNTTPLRLLSAAEQQVRVGEMIEQSIVAGSVPWPPGIAAALPTRAFAEQVVAFIGRVREVGLEPEELAALAAPESHQHMLIWRAISIFLREYLDVLDLSGVIDYTEVVHRAAGIAAATERDRYRVILVDEYQDTDPGQVRLLRALAGPGCDLIVVGDPDQAIYEFRGADSRGILEFPDAFPAASGQPAPVVVLRTSRRFGATLRDAAVRIVGTTTLAPLTREVQRRHRDLAVTDVAGSLEVLTFASGAAESAYVASRLRGLHHDGLAWDQMAVIIRRAPGVLPRLQRALIAAGVPVEVAADEVPITEEPALIPLIEVLRLVEDSELAALSMTSFDALACSPLADADPHDLRALARDLRQTRRLAGPDEVPPSSADLLLGALRLLVSGDVLPALRSTATPAARRGLVAVRRLARVISAVRGAAVPGTSVYDVLWAAWDATSVASGGTGWPQRLHGAALLGGAAGATADCDLDAVLALFATADRSDERFQGRQGVRGFLADLAGQHIPADTLAEQGIRGPAVRILTAHRAKGGEWEAVVVVGVQEQIWPDVRSRGSLLGLPDLIRAVTPNDPPSALLQERRLFYVACTRARAHLIVTAVDSATEDGATPSRFLFELDSGVQRVDMAAHPVLSRVELLADLRRAAVDEPEPHRAVAVSRLALLASRLDQHGHPAFGAADPEHWWYSRALTAGPTPVRPAGQPVRLSASQLSRVRECPVRWMLEHETHAASAPGSASTFGQVIHLLIDAVMSGELDPDRDDLEAELDRVWLGMRHGSHWESRAEREQASAALRRFLNFHLDSAAVEVVSEHEFTAVLPGGEHGVELRGRLDRVELREDGSIAVVDFKTSKSAISAVAAESDAQLGVYQVAVRSGDFASAELPAPSWLAGSPPRASAGASLIYLRKESHGHATARPQSAIGNASWVDDALVAAEQLIRSEEFLALPGEHCTVCPVRSACPAVDEGRGVL